MSARTAATAWEALFRAQVSAMRRFEAERDFAPLRPREYDVLFNLAGMGGAARQHELNERLLISQPSLSRMVDRLTAAGYVQRRVCEKDGRGVVVALTEAGTQLQRSIGRRHVRHIAKILDAALTEDEQRTLAGLTDRIRTAATASDHHRGPDLGCDTGGDADPVSDRRRAPDLGRAPDLDRQPDQHTDRITEGTS